MQCGWKRRRRAARRIGALLLGFAIGAPLGGRAQESSPEPAQAPAVELDRLLKLPDARSLEAPVRRGGATRREWQARFQTALDELEQARSALASAQHELEELAGQSEQWQIGAPGADPGAAANSPLSYRLRQEIRRQREEVERSERRLRELEVEARLAGVPEEWQKVDDAE